MSATYCCVVDNHPRFMLESLVWLHCLKQHIREEDRCVIGFINTQPDDVIDYVESQGAETFFAETLFSESPHCNKILPLLHGQHRHSDQIVITDSDLYMVENLSGFLPLDRVRMPPNNHCNPPLWVFEQIFQAAGLPTPVREGVSLFPSEIDGLRDTCINNVSGGVLMCPSHMADELAERWRYWAAWLIRHRGLMDRWKIHVDQVGVAMAAEEMGRDIDFLPPQLNAVLALLDHVTRVRSFHITPAHVPQFPALFRADKTLEPSCFQAEMQPAVEKLNTGIRRATAAAENLPSVHGFIPCFHNPKWSRKSDRLKGKDAN